MQLNIRLFLFIFLCTGLILTAIAAETSPARRIVSLAPDLTEWLYAIDSGQYIIGVAKGSDYPDAVKNIPIVASYNTLNSEAILALHPDLIIAWSGTPPAQLQLLRELHLPVYVSHIQSLMDIPRTLQELGHLVGKEAAAHEAAQVFLARYQELQKKYARTKKVRVLYEISADPLMTINKTSWINEIITLCGGVNIFADSTGIAPKISEEAVVLLNPDVILMDQNISSWQAEWQNWRNLKAVQTHHLFSLNGDWVERAGPRILKGIESVCKDLEQG